ncbi:hypothetical protein JTE90_019169 [Oedothorax gibbosus]|uniref:Alpha-soluble NSF attachment protein n=1 Tax=Oedothorax gibbosus TaxID=931172 RepID=A0AAV6UUV7_9ARAC|nr:hypothetical protein JTE90_019169 [Oedothorax gibbosus]
MRTTFPNFFAENLQFTFYIKRMATVADQQLSKGAGLMMEAEAKLNETAGGCCGAGGRIRVEEACELYVRAANAFKMTKEWHKAGNAFQEAAALQFKNERWTESARNYMDAAKAYKKVSATDCEACLIKASEIYDDVGRGKVAAKQHMTLAELYEEQGNLQRAVDEYQKAADMFSGEELASSATKCNLQIAYHSGTLGDFKRAEELFVQLGDASVNNKLLKYTATEHFMRAGLCHLTSNPQDHAGLRQKVEEWCDTSPAFSASREKSWLMQIADAAQKTDVDAFNESIRSYESVSRLADWEQSLLKRIRKVLAAGPDLR